MPVCSHAFMLFSRREMSVPRWVKIPQRQPAAAGAPPSPRRRVVGLLGGSFNPAHDGHRHISLMALKRLGLDEVWWMVSPQNPLKPAAGMAPFAKRLAGAQAAARHPRIKATDIETRLGSSYTAETLVRLARRLPRLKFVWLMGADNLQQIDQWKDWPQIFRRVLVAVFARPTYSLRALAGKAACRFARFRMSETAAHKLARATPPRWVFLTGPQSPLSATAIRAARKAPGRGKKASKGVTNRQPFGRKVKSG